MHWLVIIGLLTLGCGARGDLDRGGEDAGALVAPDAGSGARRDAGRPTPRDAGPRLPDAGPSGGPCRASMPFEIARRPSVLDDPLLARVGERALLVVTETVDDGPPTLIAAPITSEGVPTAPPALVDAGSRGTLVPRWLGGAPGFTLAFRRDDGQLGGARFTVDGALEGTTAPLGVVTDGARPALLLTERLAVSAWNAVGEIAVRGVVQDLASGGGADLVLGGQSFAVAASGTREDTFVLATHDGSRARLTELDAAGGIVSARDVDPSARPGEVFPFGVGGALAIEGAPDALVVWGGDIRALEAYTVYAELGETTARWQAVNDHLHDAAAALGGELLGIAGGLRHDEGIGRGPTPHVFFYAADPTGATQSLVVAGPLLSVDARPIQVDIMATEDGAARFLVAWTDQRGDEGAVLGALVDCR